MNLFEETTEEPTMSAERAIQTVQEQPVAVADGHAVAAAILRAANDPAMDPDRLERFMAMYERMTAREAETAFGAAMSQAQAELRAVAKDASSDKGKYASFVAIDRAARPIYSAHGFSLSFDTGDGAPADHIRLLCYVAHRDGHTRTYRVDMPADGKGAKGGDVMTKTHATGAAMTYGQRYLFKLIFNIAVGDDDDQGGSGRRREQSAGATAAIASLNACNTAAELATWKAGNGAVVQTLPEADEIIRLFNQRVAKVKESGR